MAKPKWGKVFVGSERGKVTRKTFKRIFYPRKAFIDVEERITTSISKEAALLRMPAES